MILARGGGSIEELWAFNDERVARAIAASGIPVITGVGHETDFTIADFTADLRAATPTAAATACTPDLRDLRPAIANAAASALNAMEARLAAERAELGRLAGRVERASPARRLAQNRQRVDDVSRRGQLAIANLLRNRRSHLDGVRLQLTALDPGRVLDRGYAIVLHEGVVVSSVREIATGDSVTVRVSDGAFDATVQGL
jgi:exodeoxyribonuclease VII large subunit